MGELTRRLQEVEAILAERTRELRRARTELEERDERLAHLEARQRELEQQVEQALRPVISDGTEQERQYLDRSRRGRKGRPIPGTAGATEEPGRAEEREQRWEGK